MRFKRWACPQCHQALQRKEALLACGYCAVDYPREAGIWRLSSPERQSHYRPFLEDYVGIRKAEGRSPGDPEFYRALPFRDRSQRFPDQWRIRAASYRSLLKHVVNRARRVLGKRDLLCLDLGAGNCWLSNRLSGLGLESVAVDINCDSGDGLGCHRHYENRFTPVEAAFEQLPFLEGSFDLAIYNASLHYAESFDETLSEALRVLRPEGRLVVMDTPLYANPESGRQMVREQQEDFRRRFGIPSDRLDSEHFLTWARVQELARGLHLRWDFVRPRYGIRWRLRPLERRLLGRREPAQFGLLIGRRE